jgi:hypothetical protein
MSFRVEPPALRTYANQLADAKRAAEAAKSYVHKWGDFSAHEKGLFGMIFPAHRNFVAALDAMLQHLADLTDASDTALQQEAGHYEQADLNAEARIDASYPAVPRPPVTTD